MIFLDATTDIAFKKLFSNQAKKSILISFLNSILGRVEGNLITHVTITDPHNHPETRWSKASIVDAACVDQQGNKYIIEMQVIDQKDYIPRCQFYTAEALVKQLKRGDAYTQLKPVIFVGILCFSIFDTNNYLSHHLITDMATQKQSLEHMEFHFIELPKFNVGLTKLNSVVDKWIYLLKNAADLTTIPEQLRQPEAVEEALETLERGAWKPRELDAYDRFIDTERVRASQDLATIERGKKEGREEGLRAASIKIAERLLEKQTPIAEIMQLTELSREEIHALGNSPKDKS